MILPHEPVPDLDPDKINEDDVVKWIDQVVEEFCNSRRHEWESVKNKLTGD
jgi:hypothetical protein